VSCYLKMRISGMMFFQYFALGAIIPILTLYLTRYLNFTGMEAGFILSMSSVTAFISPLVGTFIADRLVSAERFYALSHLVGGMIIFLLSGVREFYTFLIVFLFYSMLVGSTISLSNTIGFHHVLNPEKNFGKIRVWGTIGWIVAGLVFSYLWLSVDGKVVMSRLPDALKFSGLASIFLGFYSFTIPESGVAEIKREKVFPIDSLKVFLKPEIILIAVFSFFIKVVDRFFYFGAAPFLGDFGIKESNIMPIMGIGQIVEVPALFFLGFFLKKFGMKKVLLIGILAEIGRFSIFAFTQLKGLILFGLALHGIAYAFFFAAVFIFLDSRTNKMERAGVHQLFSLINSGIASFIGNIVAGFIADWAVGANAKISWLQFWVVPGIISLLTFFAVFYFFNKKLK